MAKHSVRYLGPIPCSKIDRKFREMVDQFKRLIRKIKVDLENMSYLIIALSALFVILNSVIIFYVFGWDYREIIEWSIRVYYYYFIGTEIIVKKIHSDSKCSQSGTRKTKFHCEEISFVQSAKRTTKFH